MLLEDRRADGQTGGYTDGWIEVNLKSPSAKPVCQ